jgi:hypothetical protein
LTTITLFACICEIADSVKAWVLYFFSSSFKALTIRNVVCWCVWVWYLVCDFKRRICIESICVQVGQVNHQRIVQGGGGENL